jgi:hypothetical protein
VDNNSAKSDDNGPGTHDRPFRTINKAAQVLQAGERVVIASGVYRECVRPVRGGAGPGQMISYEAAPGAQVFIKGSEVSERRLAGKVSLDVSPQAPSPGHCTGRSSYSRCTAGSCTAGYPARRSPKCTTGDDMGARTDRRDVPGCLQSFCSTKCAG